MAATAQKQKPQVSWEKCLCICSWIKNAE